MEKQNKLLLLSGCFIIALATANIIATKRIDLLGAILPAGIIAYPLTFLITDTISEVWGKSTARWVVWVGFIANILMVALFYLSRLLPPDPAWQNQEAYDVILGSVPRIVAASLIAYLASQFHDIWAFHFWRQKTGTRFLWLRNTASTFASQAIDTVLFISIAFYGVVPLQVLGGMIGAQYVAKLIFALADTPFCYLLVAWARGQKGVKPKGLAKEIPLS